MSKKKFKIGDRVKVYGYVAKDFTLHTYTATVYFVYGMKARVTCNIGDSIFVEILDSGESVHIKKGDEFEVHVKQCCKLVKKKTNK